MLYTSEMFESLIPDIIYTDNKVIKKRNIYISACPSDIYGEDLINVHLQSLVVNKSIIKDSSMISPNIPRAEWIYLKSFYLFSTNVSINKYSNIDLYEEFNNSIFYPAYEITVGYFKDHIGIHDIGMTIFDLDSKGLMENGVPPFYGMHSKKNHIPVIDPRYYSEEEHYNKLSYYPEDFIPKFQYYGSELVDDHSSMQIINSSLIPRLSFSKSSNTKQISSLPMISTKSWYLDDMMMDLYDESSVGVIESGIFIYDTTQGIGMDGCKYPSILTKEYAKVKIAEYLNNMKNIFRSKESLFGGNIRAIYSRNDVVDILRVISLNADPEDPTRIVTYKVFREDSMKNVYFKYSNMDRGNW